MNSFVRDKLKEILATYGQSLCDDPQRCEALLKDLCPEHRREVSVLVGALKEGVAADLLTLGDGSLPQQVVIRRLTKRLEDNLGIADEIALWVVESWALALRASDPSSPIVDDSVLPLLSPFPPPRDPSASSSLSSRAFVPIDAPFSSETIDLDELPAKTCARYGNWRIGRSNRGTLVCIHDGDDKSICVWGGTRVVYVVRGRSGFCLDTLAGTTFYDENHGGAEDIVTVSRWDTRGNLRPSETFFGVWGIRVSDTSLVWECVEGSLFHIFPDRPLIEFTPAAAWRGYGHRLV